MMAGQSGDVRTRSVTNRSLFLVLKPDGTSTFRDRKVLEDFLAAKFEDSRHVVSDYARRFEQRVKEKWAKYHSSEEKFLNGEASWLEKQACGGLTLRNRNTAKLESSQHNGRPPKIFSDLTERGKRKRVEPLSSRSLEELTYATGKKLQSEGQQKPGKILKNLASASSSDEWSKSFDESCSGEKPKRASAEEATALVAQYNLTKEQYLGIYTFCKEHNADILPSYDSVRHCKKECYPKDESVSITETCASVSLQGMVDKTAERLLGELKTGLESQSSETPLLLHYKGGFDGSSMHKVYKQPMTTEDDTLRSENTLIMTSLLPLRLTTSDGKLLWQNPRPNSPLSCRPLKIEVGKETAAKISSHWKDLQEQTDTLAATKVTIGDREFTVAHSVSWTMFDGKIKAELTSSSAQCCNMCGALPSLMNKTIMTVINVDALSYGLSPLHALIRTFLFIIALAIRLVLDKPTWQVRGKENQLKMENRKKEIQAEFRKEMGLLVDVPLSGGVGNTTDGNTARRAFSEPENFSKITGVSVELIKRFATILTVLRCKFEVDVDCFRKCCLATAELCRNLYNWYNLPATVHEYLFHGWQVIDHLKCPPGLMSEEAQESRTKYLRYYKLHHTRKTSIIDGYTDLLNRMVLTSDPIILGYFKKKKVSGEPYSAETLSLLRSPEGCGLASECSESDED